MPISSWSERASEGCLAGVGILNAWTDDGIGKIDGDSVIVPHSQIASLAPNLAKALRLPDLLPLLLDIEHIGTFDQPSFQFNLAWIQRNQQPAFSAARTGAFLKYGLKEYRVSNPLFALVEALEAFNKSSSLTTDDRFMAWGKVREFLPTETEQSVRVTGYLRNTRVAHASRFSLDIRGGAKGFDFDPVLFGPEATKTDDDDHGVGPLNEVQSEDRSVLPPEMHQKFVKGRFREASECKPQYALGDGWYVVLDEPVRHALSIVRKAQMADVATRREFARRPGAFLAAAMGDKYDGALFVETQEYSARVQDIGLWQPKVIPWIKRKTEPWLPETFGLKIGASYVTLAPTEVPQLEEMVIAAIKAGQAIVSFKNEPVPATQGTLDALRQISGVIKPTNTKEGGPEVPPEKASEDEAILDGFYVLNSLSNLDETRFRVELNPRTPLSKGVPSSLKSTLKAHQLDGLKWLQDSWIAGESGVLLADDMGLGKTVQALAFLAWLRLAMAKGQIKSRPILIVAPTGLLDNWQQEHARHLIAPGLGKVLRAYGAGLKEIRQEEKVRGNDTTLGEPILDKQEMMNATWVLTTYETLRDYQLSFGAIPFAIAVLDEMQKVKTPGTMMTDAVANLNADFFVGLTGTPIENRLADLWCLFETLQPGLLGNVKDFSATYEKDEDPTKLRELKRQLEKGKSGRGVMLRRMKSDLAEGLPVRKPDFVYPTQMSPEQASAYDAAISEAKGSTDQGTMLRALHRLRSISLHPIHPETAADNEFIRMSARLNKAIEILDMIAKKEEKALIFLESLDFQATLAELIKRRYRLPRSPFIISGEISGPKRQAAVNAFQDETARPGFDVMILSPRAGGVGLTLTAANHVIHLSRWWNPAVEDQCTDRVYRIGQKKDVHVYYPQAIHPHYGAQSFDERLHNLLILKRNLSREMLLPPMRPDDTRKLFEETIETGGGKQKPPFDLGSIDEMEPLQFETWVLRRLRDRGYRVSRTPRSHDSGADGIATHARTGKRIIIQCKHTQGDALCTEAAVLDLLRARSAYQAEKDILVAITNAKAFKRSALDMAEKSGVILIDRRGLETWPTL